VYRLVLRFAPRVQAFHQNKLQDGPQLAPETRAAILRKLHQTIEKLTNEFNDRWHFNTGIAAIMELVNLLVANEDELDKASGDGELFTQVLESLVLLLSPMAPYLASELWPTHNLRQISFWRFQCR
jgi:leucyl-tRNA synthetase